MLNIVIPMAGKGSRFKKAGYKTPKPFISIYDKTMIEWVVINLWPKRKHRFIFLCREEHQERLKKLFEDAEIIPIKHDTEGAACTVLAAGHLICNNDPLLIAACDQYFEGNINKFLNRAKGKDGLIMTFPSDSPSHSYCKAYRNQVSKVAEKAVISNHANLGIYYFKKGLDYLSATLAMIENNIRVNDEFYVAPVYNEMIIKGKKIGIYEIPKDKAHILGTPEHLGIFLGKLADGKVSNK